MTRENLIKSLVQEFRTSFPFEVVEMTKPPGIEIATGPWRLRREIQMEDTFESLLGEIAWIFKMIGDRP